MTNIARLHPLLQRQINKHLPEGYEADPDLQNFIRAVESSYRAYEKDKQLADHAFLLTELEYIGINAKLETEVEGRKEAIRKLKEAITRIDPLSPPAFREEPEEENLSDALEFLDAQLTRRRQIEAELISREQQLRRLSLVASANENGVLFTDPDGTICWTNEGFERLTGFNAEEIMGKTPIQLCKGPLSNAKALHDMLDSFKNGKSFRIEMIHYRKDGSHFWGRARGQAILDDKGSVLQYFAMVEDITREKLAQEKIYEFERKFKLAIETIGDDWWEFDFETGKTQLLNDHSPTSANSIHRLTDAPSEWWRCVHPDDQHLAEVSRQKYMSGDTDRLTLEYRIIDNDMNIRWILDRSAVIERYENQKPRKIIGTHSDITRIKQAEMELAQRVRQFQSLSENSPGVIFEYEFSPDGSHGYRYISPSIERIFGITPTEFLDHRKFTHPDDLHKLETVREILRISDEPYYSESRLVIPGKGIMWRSISTAFGYISEKNTRVFTGIMMDITPQKNLEKELIAAREQAERFAQSKDHFLANMSHEIRTPMNAVLGMANQLAKTNLDQKQRFYLETIHSASENLLFIINDILDLTKIRAGKLSLERIGFQPRSVLHLAVEVMLHKAEEKGLILQVLPLSPNLSPVLIGDPYRIRQILLNLLSNAIKFTTRGEINLSCEVVADGPDRQKLIISVSDTGAGMDEEFVKKIFDKFTQEHESVTRRFGGTGLGMSICKELIELMDGDIEVSSHKGEGTTVSFTIVLAKGAESDLPVKNQEQVDATALIDRRILVVDDNEMNRLVATTILGNYRPVVYEAANGEEAIEFLRTHAVDLVLMDIQMPFMSGFEATAIIRKEISPDLTVIALTANAVKGERDKCLAAGMDDYLAKPFEEAAFIGMITSWINKKGSAPGQAITAAGDHKPADVSIAPSNGLLSTTPAPTPLYNLDRLREIGNEDFVDKMIRLFLDSVPDALLKIKNAVQTGDCATIYANAHLIKPILHHLSIDSIQEEVKELESMGKSKTTGARMNELATTIDSVVGKVIEALRAR